MADRRLHSNARRRWLAYVGSYAYPEDGAPGRRVLSNARLIQAAGLEVVLGAGNATAPADAGRLAAAEPLPVYHLNELAQPSQSRIMKALRHFIWGGRTVRWLQSQPVPPDLVLMFGGYSPFAWHLLRWCRGRGVPLIIDIVEWFQPEHLPGGRLGPFHWNVELAMRHFYVQAGHVIAISRYLESYYRGRGCRVLYLPATVDVKNTPADLAERPGRPLQLAYTGIPGRKDLLDPMVEALLQEDPAGRRLLFRIVGPARAEILALPSLRRRGLTVLPGCLDVPGRTTLAGAMDAVRQADFSVLLRPPLRYAQAGFPTKVPESLAVGTPVICNLTSDLGAYIRDGREGLVCGEPSVAACRGALARALALNASEQSAMRHAARRLAERSFDYRVYVDSMRSFLAEMSNYET